MASPAVCRSCLRALRLRAEQASYETLVRPRLLSSQTSQLRRLPHRPITHPNRPITQHQTGRYASTATAGQSPPTITEEVFDARTTKPGPSESRIAQDVTQALFKECARQADYIVPQAFEAAGEIPKNAAGEDMGQGTGVWYDTTTSAGGGLGLSPTFNAWAQVTFLHMYLLTARLRYLEPERCALWLQHLHDHFFLEAEHRMTLFHKITSAAVRQRYLKEMYNQWRGVQGAYDEGLIKGDAVLGAAVWRNVFRAGQGLADADADAAEDKGVSSTPGAGQLSQGEITGDALATRERTEGDAGQMKGDAKVAAQRTQEQEEAEFDWRRVACVVAFMRRGLSRLDKASDAVIMSGKVRFGDPMTEWESVVGMESKGVTAKFEKVDEEALQRWTKDETDVDDGKPAT